MKYIGPTPSSAGDPMGEDVEFVELGEEMLPALVVGVKRLSDGVHGLKVSIEALSEQVRALKEDTANLSELLRANKDLLDEERRMLAKHLEELTSVLDDFSKRLDRSLKATLDLSLDRAARQLASMSDNLAQLSQEVQASRVESKDRSALLLESLSDVRNEVYVLKSKLNDLCNLVYEVESRVRKLEENVMSRLEEVKLLIGELSLSMRAKG